MVEKEGKIASNNSVIELVSKGPGGGVGSFEKCKG